MYFEFVSVFNEFILIKFGTVTMLKAIIATWCTRVTHSLFASFEKQRNNMQLSHIHIWKPAVSTGLQHVAQICWKPLSEQHSSLCVSIWHHIPVAGRPTVWCLGGCGTEMKNGAPVEMFGVLAMFERLQFEWVSVSVSSRPVSSWLMCYLCSSLVRVAAPNEYLNRKYQRCDRGINLSVTQRWFKGIMRHIC